MDRDCDQKGTECPIDAASPEPPAREQRSADRRARSSSAAARAACTSRRASMISTSTTDPAAVKVAAAGGNSGPVTLTVLVSETEPDAPSGSAAAGDINRAQTTVELVPVGPGTTVAGSCTPVPVSPVTGYADELTVKCSFSSLPVNTYTVSAKVAGGWYVGSAENVFTVYDPGLGFTTGGGWFYWPGTTDRTNFGYVMKYTSKLTSLKGSLLVIRHRPDGSIYRVKSNALSTLSVGEDRSIPMGWASFTGKATYLEPGWLDPLGNHTFTVYVEDRNEPGDRHRPLLAQGRQRPHSGDTVDDRARRHRRRHAERRQHSRATSSRAAIGEAEGGRRDRPRWYARRGAAWIAPRMPAG
jgi:hypothetical protein